MFSIVNIYSIGYFRSIVFSNNYRTFIQRIIGLLSNQSPIVLSMISQRSVSVFYRRYNGVNFFFPRSRGPCENSFRYFTRCPKNFSGTEFTLSVVNYRTPSSNRSPGKRFGNNILYTYKRHFSTDLLRKTVFDTFKSHSTRTVPCRKRLTWAIIFGQNCPRGP